MERNQVTEPFDVTISRHDQQRIQGEHPNRTWATGTAGEKVYIEETPTRWGTEYTIKTTGSWTWARDITTREAFMIAHGLLALIGTREDAYKTGIPPFSPHHKNHLTGDNQ